MLKKTLPPEYINMIDEFVMFQPLSKKEIKEIIKLQLNGLNALLEEQGIRVHFSKYALDLLGELGYDPIYGARPLKRVIQKKILNELSKVILSGEYSHDQVIQIDCFGDDQFQIFCEPRKE